MKAFISSLILMLFMFSAAGLHAEVRVYMFPEIQAGEDGVRVENICRLEGAGSAKYCELVIPAADYRDNIIDRSELERFLKLSFNEDIRIFGNGTMVSWIPEHENKKETEKNRIVRRGDSVLVVLSTGNITIRITGRSLSDGAVNDEIEIKLTSGKKIRCVVTGDRQARMI